MAQEKNFENRIKAYLQTKGIYALGTPHHKMKVKPIGYYEKRWGSGMTTNGLPDLHVVIKGTSIELELKAPKGRASEMQKFIVRQINESDCLGYILYENVANIPHEDYPYYMHWEQLKKGIEDLCR